MNTTKVKKQLMSANIKYLRQTLDELNRKLKENLSFTERASVAAFASQIKTEIRIRGILNDNASRLISNVPSNVPEKHYL